MFVTEYEELSHPHDRSGHKFMLSSLYKNMGDKRRDTCGATHVREILPVTVVTEPSEMTQNNSGDQVAVATMAAFGAPPIALPHFSFMRNVLLSIGFFGIQFAWTTQLTQTSPLLERLGSEPLLMSLIWWAGPITGVLVQPLVGTLSDQLRSRFGRRRPFLLLGMLLTALCLCIMPNSPTLLVAALSLWILDASINTTQGPYRALVPDVVPANKQALTYSLMACFISLGAITASYVGYIAQDIKVLFYLGAVVMMGFMGFSMLTTQEPPAESLPQVPKETTGLSAIFAQTMSSIRELPKETIRLCIAHSFTWFGLMCMFIFFSVFVAHNLFGATDPHSELYNEGIKYASLCFLVFNVSSAIFAALIGPLVKIVGQKPLHTFGLICLAGGFASCFLMSQPHQALWAMGFVGIGWATTLSIPFAIYAQFIPKGKEGVMMGTFNIFIAAPQIVASTAAGILVQLTHNDAVALLLGAGAVIMSAVLLQTVPSKEPDLLDDAA